MNLTAKDKFIWDTLYSEIGNSYGVAGLMGNLFAESSMNPFCITGAKAKNTTGVFYSNDVDAFIIPKDEFINDGVAYGLAQWRYFSRKEQLYNMARERNCSIGSIDLQIAFLLKEIKTYKTVWNTLLSAKTIKEASDIVLERYEKPANVSAAVKEKRLSYGKIYFNAYAKEEPKSTKSESKVITTTKNVFVRTGNGTNYTKIRRISKEGTEFKYIATDSTNSWYAIELEKYDGIAWISSQYSKLVTINEYT